MNRLAGAYQIRAAAMRDGDVLTWAITIPKEIGEMLGSRARPDLRFRVELVEDGILLRPVIDDKPEPIELPRWARDD